MNEKLSDDELRDLLENSQDGRTYYLDEFVDPLMKELLALRADAKVSQEFNQDVLSPLYDQMLQAGYTGTWSEMVRQAIYCKMITDTAVITGHVEGCA